MRHAQSEANKDGVYAGSVSDTRLTSDGILQLRDVSKRNTMVFSKAYVSTLSRSIESGKIFQSEQSYDMELIIDLRIHELNFGKLTGKPYRDFDNHKAYSEFDIEDKIHFYERINSFYEDIKNKDENLLIIGHSGVAKMLKTIIDGEDIESYNEVMSIEPYIIYRL